jgi:hypothetical protein
MMSNTGRMGRPLSELTKMNLSRTALVALASMIGIVTLVGSGQQAAAGSFDYLNHMNPNYVTCIRNVRAALAPQVRNDPKMHDLIIDRCNAAHPMFGNY